MLRYGVASAERATNGNNVTVHVILTLLTPSRVRAPIIDNMFGLVVAYVVCVNGDFIIIQPRQSRSKNDIEKREPKR